MEDGPGFTLGHDFAPLRKLAKPATLTPAGSGSVLLIIGCPIAGHFGHDIIGGTISHDADANLTRHVLNGRLVRGRGRAGDDGHALYLLEKPGHGRLIDAAVAAILAVEAMAHAEPQKPDLVPLVALR